MAFVRLWLQFSEHRLEYAGAIERILDPANNLFSRRQVRELPASKALIF